MILRAKPEHLELLLPLFEAYRAFYRQEAQAELAKDFLAKRLKQEDSVIYLAMQGDTAVGFVQLYPIFSSTQMKRLWLLNDLYVASEHRRKGYSVALIDRCKALCKATNASGLMLETEKSNEAGNRLYPKCDFQLDEAHHYYFWALS